MSTSETIMDAFRSILKPIVREVLDEAGASQPATEHKPRRVYTRQEVCKMLKIGTTTFYRLVKKGKLTILKVEGKTVIDADDLDNAITTKEIFRYQHS
jgi:excisionase family DNA binding protein